MSHPDESGLCLLWEVSARDSDGMTRLRRDKATNNALCRYPCSTELFDHQATLLPCQRYLMADQITPLGSFVSSPLTPPPTDVKAAFNIHSILNGFRSHYRESRPTPWRVYPLKHEKYKDLLQILKSDTDLDSHIKCKVRLVWSNDSALTVPPATIMTRAACS